MGFVYPVADSPAYEYGLVATPEGETVPALVDGSTVWVLNVEDGLISLTNIGAGALSGTDISHGVFQRETDYRTWVLDAAEYIAEVAHEGMVDAGGNDYYGGHVINVAMQVSEDTHGNEFAVAVAYLHDVLEQTKVTANELRKVMPEEVLDAVVALTHGEHEDSYRLYLSRVTKNPLAALVKRAEVEDNRDVTRLREVTDKAAWELLKYDFAARYLDEKLKETSI